MLCPGRCVVTAATIVSWGPKLALGLAIEPSGAAWVPRSILLTSIGVTVRVAGANRDECAGGGAGDFCPQPDSAVQEIAATSVAAHAHAAPILFTTIGSSGSLPRAARRHRCSITRRRAPRIDVDAAAPREAREHR